MNKSSNLLNGSLLGTAGRSNNIFLKATEWSSAQVTAVLSVKRKLINASKEFVANITTNLSAGRYLKITATPEVDSTVTVINRHGVTLNINTICYANESAVLQKMRAIKLATSTTPSVSSVLILSVATPVGLAITQSCIAQATTGIRAAHPKSLAILNESSIDSNVLLTRVGKLKASYLLSVLFNKSILSEASRIRAPIERVSLVPRTNRISIVTGN